jgi:N-acetylmuramic acid 6-phosphate etherase
VTALVLGLECGGTRTVALLVDARGRCLRRLEAGPANLRLMSDAQMVDHFRSVADQVPRVAAVGIGMAGVNEDTERRRIRAMAARVWPGLPCWAGSDLETALAVTGVPLPAGARLVVVSGTGSCCYGANAAGRIVKAGGWGHILGDRGSAYDIGLQSLRAVMREYDEDGRWPALGARLLGALLLNGPNDLVTWAQAATKTDIAALALEVSTAASRGDSLARRCMSQAARILAEDAAICVRRLGLVGQASRLCSSRVDTPQGRQAGCLSYGGRAPVECFITGSVLLKQPFFSAVFKRHLNALCPGAVIRPLPREGAWGAVARARALVASLEPPGLTLTPERASSFSGTGDQRLETRFPLPVPTALSETEQRNPRSMNLDRLSLNSAIELMLREDARIPRALLQERPKIARVVRLIVRALRQGGRLFYVGAGTSGRVGVLDASECPPTFRTAPDLVQGIIAGGQTALWSAVEGAEDDAEAGAQAVRGRGVGRKDVVVGLAASGRTPFVWGALHAARGVGAATVLVCFNRHWRIARSHAPTVVIAPEIGPEILTGSTRLKAGTATKVLLNLFTTLAMARLGKVASNLMVDLNPSNLKLRDRAVRIVQALTGSEPAAARRALEKGCWVITRALRTLNRGKKRTGFGRHTGITAKTRRPLTQGGHLLRDRIHHPARRGKIA